MIQNKKNSLFDNNHQQNSFINNNINNSFISNSILFTKGASESILNTEAKTRNSNKNRGLSFSEYAILNNLSSEKSVYKNINNNSNLNVLNKNNTYNNHIIYEDDYLIDKDRSKNKGRNGKFLSSPNKINNNLISSVEKSLLKSSDIKGIFGLSGNQNNRYQTPIKNKNNLSIFNTNQSRNLANTEQRQRTLLPKLKYPYFQKENFLNNYNDFK